MNMEHIPRQMQDSNLNINDALVEIERIEQEERQRGRFDSEGDAFARLRKEVAEQLITPEEAAEKARAIAEARQEL